MNSVKYALIKDGSAIAYTQKLSSAPVNLILEENIEGHLLKEVSQEAFLGSGIRTVVIPKTVEIIGSFSFADTPNLQQVSFQTGSQLGHIHPGAFNNAIKLTNITIPNTVTGIGSQAFGYTGLRTVTIPLSVTFMNYGVF